MPQVGLAQSLRTLPYRTGVLAWWLVMQFFLIAAYYLPLRYVNILSSRLAEWAMLAGYDLTGKERLASPGIMLMQGLVDHLDYEGIRATKVRQAIFYRQALKGLLKRDDFWLPTIEKSDFAELRGFPLIMNLKVAGRFLSQLRQHGVITRFELDDSPWSTKHKIIYLPMGIHLTDSDLTSIVDTLYNN